MVTNCIVVGVSLLGICNSYTVPSFDLTVLEKSAIDKEKSGS